ncbi:MOB kinase activator-like 1A [Lolium rigidum]|uniref:MOB kinase activator-like 1A n=1 Tax=Lolium rigidum TaxID=89674 RepID=UPI001F5DFFD0|nr:MOB kinase activator-like 1A [Lolium rigidum]
MSLFGLGSNKNQRTFRPKKNAPSSNKGVQLKKHIDATLGSGNLRDAVRLPPGEELNEWLAVNTVDFFNQVNILYGTLIEFCTPATCPTMTAGSKFEYRWADGVQIKKPIEVSAPKYVEYLMDWIEVQLDDESLFPQKLGTPFPPNFREVVKTIFKRLFRVYAHIYHTHFQKIVSLKEEAHLNTCFKHFTLFTWEFKLIDKAELAPLIDLIESIVTEQKALHYELHKNIALQRRVTISQAEKIQRFQAENADLKKQLSEAQGASSSLAASSSELETLRASQKNLEAKLAEAEQKISEKNSELARKTGEFELKRQTDSDIIQKQQKNLEVFASI